MRCWRPPAGGPLAGGPLPVANGLHGDTFWLIAALGDQANYVRNLRADPRVRVKARPARLRALAADTRMLTIRIDLDPPTTRRAH